MTAPEDAPLIVTAVLDPVTQSAMDDLRVRHFPSERNHLQAHVTLFHHLDPAGRDEVDAVLGEAALRLPLPGRIGPPRSLGRGVAIPVDCDGLVELRGWIAGRVPGPLTRQDSAWRWPHVTVQNKVAPAAARALLASLAAAHEPAPLEVVALRLWRYLGGPWELLATHPSA